MVSGAMRPGDGSNHSTSSDAFAKTLRFGLAAALMLFAVQSAIGLFAALALNSYDSVFDLDRNNGIPDLLSTGAILATAFGAAKLAAAAKRDRWQAATLALLLAVVAVDDLFQQEVDLGNAWGMSVAVALVPSALLIVVIALRAPRRAALTLLIGLFLLVVAVKNAYEYDQFLNILGARRPRTMRLRLRARHRAQAGTRAPRLELRSDWNLGNCARYRRQSTSTGLGARALIAPRNASQSQASCRLSLRR
jgi:hypothetical protein